jgi:hypothetical protein
MSRLTYRLTSNSANLYEINAAEGDKVKESVARQNAFDRLAAYEDIGTVEDFADFARAKQEGRLVVLPCKVGDTVYLTVHGYVEETKVRTFFVGHPSYNRGEPDPRYEMIRCTNYDLPMKYFGKTVFLTREAAEA